MVDHVQEGYTQSVRCLICARPARRGATLCAQCRAAVRRVRHTPNTKPEYLPQDSVVRTDIRRSVERKASYSRAARRASRAGEPPPGGWGIYATIIAFGLAVCLTGYLAIGDGERAFYLGRAAIVPAMPADARDETAAKADARADVAAKAAAATPSPAVDAEVHPELASEEHLAIFESLAVAPRAKPVRKAAREGTGGRGTGAALGRMNSHNLRIEPAPPPAAFPDTFAAALLGLSESAPTDRWEQLASAQQQCERDNVIAELVCKERTRLQYCEGEWGAAPQCPAAVLSHNTR